MSTAQEIEQAAMKLPRKDRVQLAARLMASAETKREKGIAEAWANESAARSEAHRKGTLKAVPLRQAFGFEV